MREVERAGAFDLDVGEGAEEELDECSELVAAVSGLAEHCRVLAHDVLGH
jgi:hypothetical protein